MVVSKILCFYQIYPWKVWSNLRSIHPGRLTWNIQITHLERNMIFHTPMIMFHVNLPGCIIFQMSWNQLVLVIVPSKLPRISSPPLGGAITPVVAEVWGRWVVLVFYWLPPEKHRNAVVVEGWKDANLNPFDSWINEDFLKNYGFLLKGSQDWWFSKKTWYNT